MDQTDREIDVAFALEGVPSVVAVHALRARAEPDGAYDFAVVLRPMRGLTLAEVHYRLLMVLTQEECGRVLFVDADMPAPLPMHGAHRLTVPSGARDAAALRAMERVEDIARRHDLELVEAAAIRAAASRATAPVAADAAVEPLDAWLAFERAVDTSIALEADPAVTGVFVVERRRRGRLRRLDVFVELGLRSEAVFEAHRRVVDYRRGGVGRILYGDAHLRIRYLAHRITLGPFDRVQAARRRDLRHAERPVLDWIPLRDAIDACFAAGPPSEPILLHIEGTGGATAEDAPRQRPRVLLVHAEPGVDVALRAMGGTIDLSQAKDGWEALDLVQATKFDLVLSALRVGEMRGVQLYRAAVAADPALAERFYFVTTAAARDAAPPSAALARVLSFPLDPEEIRRLLGLP